VLSRHAVRRDVGRTLVGVSSAIAGRIFENVSCHVGYSGSNPLTFSRSSDRPALNKSPQTKGPAPFLEPGGPILLADYGRVQIKVLESRSGAETLPHASTSVNKSPQRPQSAASRHAARRQCLHAQPSHRLLLPAGRLYRSRPLASLAFAARKRSRAA